MQDFALAAWFTRWQGSVRHNLSASDSESLTIPALLAMADAEDAERWASMRLGYAGPAGSDWLRETIAERYAGLGPDQVACFTGAQEGLYCAMHAMLGPNDHAVIVTPNYQTTELIPGEICATSGVALDPAQRWGLDIDAVRDALRPNTRVVAINFPNNPTGALLPRARLQALIELCRARGIWLFSDEVYRLIERDPARRLPAVVDAYERGVSLNVVSKAYGLAGLRIGWIATRDTALLERAVRVRERLSGSSAGPSEVLANIAIKATERIVGRNRALADGNLDLLAAFFADRRDLFDWVVPEGGVIGYPRHRGPEGVNAFATRLAAEAGVLVVPGEAFASALTPSPAGHFRIGFGRADLPDALEAFGEHLDRPQSQDRHARVAAPG